MTRFSKPPARIDSSRRLRHASAAVGGDETFDYGAASHTGGAAGLRPTLACRDGGQVYRVVLAENRVEPVDLINEALPPDYYRLRSRVDVRREVDEALQEIGIANRDALIDDSIAAVKLWLSTKAPN